MCVLLTRWLAFLLLLGTQFVYFFFAIYYYYIIVITNYAQYIWEEEAIKINIITTNFGTNHWKKEECEISTL